MTAELIRVVPVLDGQEQQQLLAFVQQQPFASSTVFGPGGEAMDQHPARTSSSVLLDEQHASTQLLHERLNQAVLHYALQLQQLHPAYYGWPLPGAPGVQSWREPLQALRYQPGERYTYHQDCHFSASNPASKRVLSVVLYLNADFSGGETEFAGRRIKPSPGEAVMFPSNWCFPHAGCEVFSGTKYALVTWYHAHDLMPTTGASS